MPSPVKGTRNQNTAEKLRSKGAKKERKKTVKVNQPANVVPNAASAAAKPKKTYKKKTVENLQAEINRLRQKQLNNAAKPAKVKKVPFENNLGVFGLFNRANTLVNAAAKRRITMKAKANAKKAEQAANAVVNVPAPSAENKKAARVAKLRATLAAKKAKKAEESFGNVAAMNQAIAAAPAVSNVNKKAARVAKLRATLAAKKAKKAEEAFQEVAVANSAIMAAPVSNANQQAANKKAATLAKRRATIAAKKAAKAANQSNVASNAVVAPMANKSKTKPRAHTAKKNKTVPENIEQMEEYNRNW
jgi:hypothetical protein